MTGRSACLVGFDGKLPSRGDFLSVGLPRSFLTPWRDWTEQALMASQTALGDDWGKAWVVAPIWHFACPGGMAGPDAFLGFMLPSVDKAGRYFPLAVVALFPGMEARSADEAAAGWREKAQAAALDALAHDHDPAVLAEALAGLAPPEPKPLLDSGSVWWTTGGPQVPAGRREFDALPPAQAFAEMIGAGTAWQ